MRHLIFDTETTDLLKPSFVPLEKQPHIIEFFGILWNDAADDTQEHGWLFKPPIPIPPAATKVNRITNEMVATAPLFAEKAPVIRALLLLADVIVAHNVAFDQPVLDIAFRRTDTPEVKFPRSICTVETTEHLLGYRLSLGALYRFLFAEDFAGAHRAAEDVRALLRCYMELRKRGIVQ